jgi:hypothetical protein
VSGNGIKPASGALRLIRFERFTWLMRGDIGDSNPSDAAAASLKFDAYYAPHKKMRGETMSIQTVQDAGGRRSERAETMRDLALVASFGLWAVLLGAMPVLAFQFLIAG